MLRGISCVFCVAMVLGLAGCREKEVYPSRQPDRDNVVGHYRLVGDEDVIAKFGRNGSLELKKDGTFVMSDMPGWRTMENDVLEEGKEWSGEGTWDVRDFPRDVQRWGLRLDFSVVSGRARNIGVGTVYFGGAEPPHQIRIPIGDPDNGERIVLEKIQ